MLGTYDGKLCMCEWIAGRHTYNDDGFPIDGLRQPCISQTSPTIRQAIAQLDEYFAGSRFQFDLPLMMQGTVFQQAVWQALSALPYSATTTYAAIAYRIGNPKAVRAVANAIGRNPLQIIIPCHRVIGSNGSLTGYAGGLSAKCFLRALELANEI